MPTQIHSPTSPSYFPRTPRIPKLALPEEPIPTRGPSRLPSMADQRRPITPARPSTSRPNPTSGQPAKPLRSILKGSRNPDVRDSYESDGEILAAKKVANSVYNVPNVPPPGSRLVPMKPPAFDLHWQLLPYDNRRSRRVLRFDMAFPVEQVAWQEQGDRRTRLTEAELDKPAANGMMTKMTISFTRGPFSWEVDVKNSRGIRCRDVFQAIYDTFNEQLTLEEQRLVQDPWAVNQAFRLRCKLAQGLPEVELAMGWKRVDVLMHQTIFLGLTQPKSGSDWVLNLGRRVLTPDNS